MLNKIIVMGRLTHEPELRKTAAGLSVCTSSIACERSYEVEGKRQTDFLDIVLWRGRADNFVKYFRKGDMVCIEGRLEQRKWVDKDGGKRVSYEIFVTDFYFTYGKKRDDTEQRAPIADVKPAGEFVDVDEFDDLPF